LIATKREQRQRKENEAQSSELRDEAVNIWKETERQASKRIMHSREIKLFSFSVSSSVTSVNFEMSQWNDI
jgi:hypothetical protein